MKVGIPLNKESKSKNVNCENEKSFISKSRKPSIFQMDYLPVSGAYNRLTVSSSNEEDPIPPPPKK